MRKKWRETEDAWLLQAADVYSTMADLVDAFHAEFGKTRTDEAIRSRFWKSGLQLANTTNKPLTEEELEYLKANAETMTHKELCEGLKRLTGRTAHPVTIARICSEKLNVRHGQTNKKRVGYEKTLPDGTTLVKTELAPQGGGKNFTTKARIMYEQYHGVKVPKGSKIVFLNGNNQDFSKENLYPLSLRYCFMMGKNGWFSTDRDLTLAAIKYCELFGAIKDVKS